MAWEILYNYLGTDYDITAVNTRNVIGTALVSTAYVDEGDDGCNIPLPGIYRFTMGAGDTVTVSQVSENDAANPDFFSGSRSVVCDGVTENVNLIPGIAVILAATAAENDIFEIAIGSFWLTLVNKWVAVASMGACLAGSDPSEGISLKVKNNTGRTQIQSMISLTDGMLWRNDLYPTRPILSNWQPNNIMNLNWITPALFTFHNVHDGLCDILVNSYPSVVKRVSDGVYLDTSPGRLIAYDGVEIYEWKPQGYPDDSVHGPAFILSADLAETDAATFTRYPASQYLEISIDGGEWQAASAGAFLSVDGYAEGVVPDLSEITVRLRRNIASDADVDWNPYQFCFRIDSVGI